MQRWSSEGSLPDSDPLCFLWAGGSRCEEENITNKMGLAQIVIRSLKSCLVPEGQAVVVRGKKGLFVFSPNNPFLQRQEGFLDRGMSLSFVMQS